MLKLCLRLLLLVLVLAASDWAFRKQARSVYALYGQYFLVTANAFCGIGWVWLVAKIGVRWRELKPERFRYSALALVLVIGLVWSQTLAANFFSLSSREGAAQSLPSPAAGPMEY